VLLAFAGADVEVEVDPARLRSVDTPEIVGDNGRLRADTGWSQAIPLTQTLRDLYDWYANAV
jgi:GDP-4-dehydro-6-deoxy-D-mannose reductase